MITLIFEAIYNCCLGFKPNKKEMRLLYKIKDDIEELTIEELEHLKNFLHRNNRTCC